MLAAEPVLCREPDALQRDIDKPVVAQQVDPGEHPHEIVDPERGQDQNQKQTFALAGFAGNEVGHRVADDHADHARPKPRSQPCGAQSGRFDPRTDPRKPQQRARVPPQAGSIPAPAAERSDGADPSPPPGWRRREPEIAGRAIPVPGRPSACHTQVLRPTASVSAACRLVGTQALIPRPPPGSSSRARAPRSQG